MHHCTLLLGEEGVDSAQASIYPPLCWEMYTVARPIG